MMRRALAVALFAAAPLAAQTAPVGSLNIADERFAQSDIVDARAMPDINGTAGIMITLSPIAAKRLSGLTAALVGKPMRVTLDGKALMAEMIRSPIRDGVIEVPARYSLTEAEALAKRISGKDPLPDELSD